MLKVLLWRKLHHSFFFFFWMLKALFSCEGSCIVLFSAAQDTLTQRETRIKGQNFNDVASDLRMLETRVPRESLTQLNLQTKFTFFCTSLSPVKLHWCKASVHTLHQFAWPCSDTIRGKNMLTCYIHGSGICMYIYSLHIFKHSCESRD